MIHPAKNGVRMIAFSWNAKPVYQHPSQVFTYCQQACMIRDIIRRNQYYMIPEIGDEGKLHWHGVVFIKNNVAWHRKELQTFRYKGFVKIKTNVDDYWTNTYMEKDQEEMKEILGMNEIHLCNCGDCKKGAKVTYESFQKDYLDNPEGGGTKPSGIFKYFKQN